MNLFQLVYDISPISGLTFETTLFNLAEKMVEGYRGGAWGSVIGTTTSGEKTPFQVCPGAERLRVVNPLNGCDETTDSRSAGAALSIIATNLTLWKMHERGAPLSDLEQLERLYFNVKDAVFNDPTLDTSAIFNIID